MSMGNDIFSTLNIIIILLFLLEIKTKYSKRNKAIFLCFYWWYISNKMWLTKNIDDIYYKSIMLKHRRAKNVCSNLFSLIKPLNIWHVCISVLWLDSKLIIYIYFSHKSIYIRS